MKEKESSGKKDSKAEFLVEEWKEARTTIRKYEEHVLNLRKYGFTLATLLIGADAYLSISANITIHQMGKAATAIAIMVLVVALFLIDLYMHEVKVAAARRASELEGILGSSPENIRTLTGIRREIDTNIAFRRSNRMIFNLFILATAIVGAVSIMATPLDPNKSQFYQIVLPYCSLSLFFIAFVAFIYNPFFLMQLDRYILFSIRRARTKKNPSILVSDLTQQLATSTIAETTEGSFKEAVPDITPKPKNWFNIIFGIFWIVGFIYWTVVLNIDGWNWWSLLTIWAMTGGIGVIAEAFQGTKEKTIVESNRTNIQAS